jgi:hypothetical protein
MTSLNEQGLLPNRAPTRHAPSVMKMSLNLDMKRFTK